MIDLGRWYLALLYAFVLWQESGENPAIFCYLICWGLFATLRSRDFAPTLNSVRLETACSNPSFTFSTLFTIQTGSEN